jgi:nucleoside-diphosphate-sugar epimerase
VPCLGTDFRKITAESLHTFDVVMHLAAISNDPMGALNPQITREINGTAVIDLAAKAKQAGVRKFMFSSSCSVYGRCPLATEETAVYPQSVYAESKMAAEAGIRQLEGDLFRVVILRNATAFGWSAMFRTDLVFNDFIRSARSGLIQVNSDGSPVRPLIHCRDIARAFREFLRVDVSGTFNVGAANYTVSEIAAAVAHVFEVPVQYGTAGPDKRDYRVSFDKFNALFPDFGYSTVEAEASIFKTMMLPDLDSKRFVRLDVLRGKLLQLYRTVEGWVE